MPSFLENPFVFLAIGAGALIISAVSLWRVQKVSLVIKKLFAGKKASDLEELILRHDKQLASHEERIAVLQKIINALKEVNRLNIQKLGIVRFNPFPEVGGNMSFSMAMLDGDDNGVVISSLYLREGVRVYAKPIMNGKSEYELSNEEQKAIAQSKSNIKDHFLQ